MRELADDDQNILDVYSMFSGDTASVCEAEVIEDFCRGRNLSHVESGCFPGGSRGTVWLDDRVSIPSLEGRGDTRQYDNPLTATGLMRALNRMRFHHETLPDAARRLIYISDLPPSCILALTATASTHQVPVLRNSIYKHLTSKISIAVKIPSIGFLTFQLDLHLPYFLLKKSHPPKDAFPEINPKSRTKWIDLSFLMMDASESHSQELKEVWGVHEVQISCVVTGSDDWRWVAYGFVDNEIDGSQTDLNEYEMCIDRIAAGQLVADVPIWRPRDYWLTVFKIRIKEVRGAWEYLIHKVELSANQYVCWLT